MMDPRPANEDPGAASPATVLADRIGERARSGEFVVFGGSALRDGESAGDPDQWAAVKAGHLARAAELARSL
ncbi:hypothetical protein AB0K16_45500 [Nonomuraea jabiensis]|uniref:hypothetical protein n=1 Tax=Nonomuraea jabiensis TaxID=882448 RepID=UPI0034457BF2